MNAARNFIACRTPDFCLLIYVLTATVGLFTGGIWASFGIGAALVLFFGVWFAERRAPLPDRQLILFAGVVLLVATVLNLQSLEPRLSWHTWLQLATIFLPLCLFANPGIQKRAASAQFFDILPVAAAIGLVAISLELLAEGPLLKFHRGPAAQLYQYNRGFSYMVILAFPILASLWVRKRRWFVLPFIALLFVPANYTESRAAKLALMLALAVTFAAYVLPVFTRWTLALACMTLLAWPFAAQALFLHHRELVYRLPPSWQDRIEIWDYISYRILEKPVLGWGLGTSAILPFEQPHGAQYHFRLAQAPHPHNALLQLWVELGLAGVALGIGFLLLVLFRTRNLRPDVAPFALGALTASLCLSLIAYNLWSDSLWAAFALCAFVFALLERQNGKKPF
ncbi:MAG: O-antigen ligase family protein [Bdellovibrionales bacterium]